MNINPYKDISGLQTFKGDLHFHSSISDGEVEPALMFERLCELKFDFCSLTDHDIFCDKIKHYNNLMVLPGQEFSAETGHILSLFSKINRDKSWSTREQLDAIKTNKGFSILSHPKIREFVTSQGCTYTPERLLCELSGNYNGIEIYTHNVSSGFKLAIDRLDVIWSASTLEWGALRSKPFSPVWGFAASDGHRPEHISENVGIILWAQSLNRDHIQESLRAGAFYSLANTKARFTEISYNNGIVEISTTNAVMIKIIRTGGAVAGIKCLTDGKEGSASYSCDGTEGYLRFEAMDSDGNSAYSNPILVEAPHA